MKIRTFAAGLLLLLRPAVAAPPNEWLTWI